MSILKRAPEYLMTMAISFAAFVAVPGIVNAGMGKESNLLLSILGLFACCAVAGGGTVFLRFRECRKLSPSLGRVISLAIIYILAAPVISVISGMIAVVVYGVFFKVLGVGQIKGIIDFLVTGMILALMPVCGNLYWYQIKSKEPFFTTMKKALRIKGNTYLRVLICLLLLLAAGWLILTVFHYLPVNAITTAVKVLIFGSVGVVGLIAVEKQCEEGVCSK